MEVWGEGKKKKDRKKYDLLWGAFLSPILPNSVPNEFLMSQTKD